MGECLSTHIKQQREARTALIKTITENSEFVETELTEEPLERLEKLSKALIPETPTPNYEGQGGVHEKVDKDAIGPPPPVVLVKDEPKEVS
jgi:hypothetical protein